jgi:hypothetical protein
MAVGVAHVIVGLILEEELEGELPFPLSPPHPTIARSANREKNNPNRLAQEDITAPLLGFGEQQQQTSLLVSRHGTSWDLDERGKSIQNRLTLNPGVVSAGTTGQQRFTIHSCVRYFSGGFARARLSLGGAR